MVCDGGSVRLFDLDTAAQPATTELRQRAIENEGTLESLLHANPGVLLSEPVFVFGRQPAVETGILDLLALDQYGNLVIFELKVGKSGSGSASEETILSQPQNYAQSLATYGYEALNEIYQDYQEDIRNGRWEVGDSAVPAPELAEAFEHVFGRSLGSEEFNAAQRMVIIAETITRRTKRNAHYLLEEGLNLQCMEIQRFQRPESVSTAVATSMVVDYELSRIRPDEHQNPAHPDQVRKILDIAFPEIRELIHAERIESVVAGLDGRNPNLTSQNPDHPESISYSIRVKPDFGHVRVVINLDQANEEVLATLRANAEIFNEHGFEVSQTRSQQRIVLAEWDISEATGLDEGLRADVARQFVRLVELGHKVVNLSDIEDAE